MINLELLRIASAHIQKQGFVPAGDPAMDPSAGGGAGAAGGMDPAAMGMDPAAMGMGGGAPPAAPPPMPASPPMAPATQGVEPIKPKIDVNVTMLQVLKVLTRIADSLGVQIPASEMVATQGDLTQFGMQQAGQQASGAPAPAPAPAPSAIPPIQPMAAATKSGSVGSPDSYSQPVPDMGARAQALLALARARAGKA